MPTVPTEAEVLGWFEKLSNWGRFGADDQLGTLNLVTAEHRRKAAALVTEGASVSCAWDISTMPQIGDHFGPPQRHMLMTGEGLADKHRVVPPHPVPGVDMSRSAGAVEYFGCVFHGVNITHIDALSHVFWDRMSYNGKPAELVNAMFGATNLAVTGLRDGIFTRGVLIDVPAVRGVDWLEPGEGVMPEDLEAAENRQGVRVSIGDVVLLRTGYSRRKREQGPLPIESGQAGWHAACLPWLHARGVSAIGCDTAQDVVPSGYTQVALPIHSIGIVAMGLWLLDACDLEALAATAARLRRWEFCFTVAPLRIEGGTGSPVNPVASF
ncbi:MAG: cyclase family protein [Candidatus Binatia bacterium]